MNTLKAYLELIRYPLFAIPIAATLPRCTDRLRGGVELAGWANIANRTARLFRRHDEERLLPP